MGHRFCDADQEVIDFFKAFLAECSVKTISGEEATVGSVSQKVKDRIALAELFVGILTRLEEKATGVWSTSEWVLQERTHAAALGKKIILLKEKGVELQGGLHGDHEYIEFDREKMHRATIKLMQMIWSLNPGKMTLNKQGGPQISIDFIEAAVAAQPNEPMLRVQLAQLRNQAGQTNAAIQELTRVLETHPDFSPARLELVKALRMVGRMTDAHREVQRLMSVNPLDGQAHHQFAHILAAKGKSLEALDEFAKAESCQPGDWGHGKCHAELLLTISGGDRKRLLEARDLIAIAVELGGSNAEGQLKGHMMEIHRRLSKTRPERQKKKKSKKRR